MSNSIVETIRDELRLLGVVKSEADFCQEWLGRGEGYLRTLRFTDTQPSAAALAFCADRLDRLAAHVSNTVPVEGDYWAARFGRYAEQCRVELADRLRTSSERAPNCIAPRMCEKYLPKSGGSSATPDDLNAHR